MSDIGDLLAPLIGSGEPPPVEQLECQVRRRRRNRRVGAGLASIAAMLAGAVISVSLAGRSPQSVSVTGPPTPIRVTLPADQLVQDISAANGRLLLTGQPLNPSSALCTAIPVDPNTLALGPTRQGNCDNPSLKGHQVGVVVAQGSSRGFDSTVKVATANPVTGKTSLGPVLFSYADSSSSRPVWVYGGNWLWIYDVDTPNGPEVVQVSASTGQRQSTVAMPKLYRPVLAANDDGLWAGDSIEGGGAGIDTLYQVAPGAHEATPVIPGTAVVRWLVAAGHEAWVGTSQPGGTAQEIWRFDGPAHTQALRVPESGFNPTTVIGDQADGLWTMQWQPPLGPQTPQGSRNQQIIRIDPNTGSEQVAATLPAVPIPAGAGAYGLLEGQATVLDGAVYLLEPPFRANGYQGYNTLVRIPVSDNLQANFPPTTTVTASPTVGVPMCRASQLKASLEGIQGAAGNLTAWFWIGDSSPHPCVLASPAQIDFLDASGRVRLTASTSFGSIPLSASTPVPLDNKLGSGQLVSVLLVWPTDALAADLVGSTSGRCPTPDFVPTAVQLSFGDSGAVVVTHLRIGDTDISICGHHISIVGVDPTPPG